MSIIRLPYPVAEPEDWPPIRGTYCPARPLDGLPEHEIDDERDKKLARKITLWTIGCVIGYALAYFAHGRWG
jgi:hypothetical protein